MSNRFPWSIIPPSTGDKLVAGGYGLKFEVLRFKGDDGDPPDLHIEYELRGSLDGDDEAASVLLSLLRSFREPRGESEGVV